MTRSVMRPGFWLALAGALACILAAAPRAVADHHEVKIREFSPGLAATANDAFLELQMYNAGQNLVAGHFVQVYPPGNAPPTILTLDGPNPPNSDNQRTVLIGGANVTGRDFTENLDASAGFSPAGGAICFVSANVLIGGIDCVEWGSGNNQVFRDPAVLPLGIPDGSSITRSITPLCSTLLQPGDDSTVSETDFSETAPTPRNNSVVPTESACVLTVNVSGLGIVTAPGISCPPDCTEPFFNGDQVTLTASPIGGSTFTGWNSCTSVAGDQCVETLEVSQDLAATFAGGSPPQPPATLPASDNSAQCAALKKKLKKAKTKKKKKKIRKQLRKLGC